jgi:DNA repair photolyase
MKLKEIKVKSALSRSRISDKMYCLNPYIGCQHGCRYCYATFMKRFTGHNEKWGSFVDIKINVPQLLIKELQRVKKWEIMISSVTDPYQPLERKYHLTRRCLKILLEHQFPLSILTKSSLILRDVDILTLFNNLEVGLTITTNEEAIKKIFEPYSSPISERIRALRILHDRGIKTYAFIGPILPQNPKEIVDNLWKIVDFVYIDRMNYCYKIERVYQMHGLEKYLEDNYFYQIGERLKNLFNSKGVEVRVLF